MITIGQEFLFLLLLPAGREAALASFLSRYAQVLWRSAPEAHCACSCVHACSELWKLYPECSLARLLSRFSNGDLAADCQTLLDYAARQACMSGRGPAPLEQLEHDSEQVAPVLRSLFLSLTKNGVFYDLHESQLLCISFLDSFGRTKNPVFLLCQRVGDRLYADL